MSDTLRDNRQAGKQQKKMKETQLITLDKTYLKEKFVEYNQLYFNNSLPKVPIFSIVNTPNLA